MKYNLSQKKILEKIRRYLELCGAESEFIDEFFCGFCSGLSSLWLYSQFLSHSTKAQETKAECDDAEWFWSCLYVISEWNETDPTSIGRLIEPFINKVYFLQNAKFILNKVNQDDFDYIISDTKNRKFERGFSKVIAFRNHLELKEILEIFNKNDFILLKLAAINHEFALVKNGGSYILYDPNSASGEFMTSDLNILAQHIIQVLDLSGNPRAMCLSLFKEKSEEPLAPVCEYDLLQQNISRYPTEFLEQIIFCAAAYGDYELLVKILQRNRLDLNKFEIGGTRALDVASQNNYANIVELLLDYGASPNIENAHGYTAWMLALAHGSLETVKVYVDHRVIRQDSRGRDKNPIEIAGLSGDRELETYLQTSLSSFPRRRESSLISRFPPSRE